MPILLVRHDSNSGEPSAWAIRSSISNVCPSTVIASAVPVVLAGAGVVSLPEPESAIAASGVLAAAVMAVEVVGAGASVAFWPEAAPPSAVSGSAAPPHAAARITMIEMKMESEIFLIISRG